VNYFEDAQTNVPSGHDLFGRGDWITPARVAKAGFHIGEFLRANLFDRSIQINGEDVLRLRHPLMLYRGSRC